MCVSSTKWKKLGLEATPNRCDVFYFGNGAGIKEKIEYWVKEDIAKELLRRIFQALNGHNIALQDIERIDIVFGGDHGKGAFRLPVKVILTISAREKAINFVDVMATIFCRTDSTEILERTIATDVNDTMEKLVKNCLVFTQKETEPIALYFADDFVLVPVGGLGSVK